MGTARLFLKYTENKDTFHQVLQRLRGKKTYRGRYPYIEPMITLVRTSTPEIAYGVLRHIMVLVKHDPSVYFHSFVHFYCW